jgi:hypothetical protein
MCTATATYTEVPSRRGGQREGRGGQQRCPAGREKHSDRRIRARIVALAPGCGRCSPDDGRSTDSTATTAPVRVLARTFIISRCSCATLLLLFATDYGVDPSTRLETDRTSPILARRQQTAARLNSMAARRLALLAVAVLAGGAAAESKTVALNLQVNTQDGAVTRSLNDRQ